MALKGKQKKLDKNNNGRIDAQDFKILQGSKKGMRMGELVSTGNKKTSLRKAERKKQSKPLGYGSARTSGMGLQDESMKPGKAMKARKGRLAEYERGFDVDPLVRSGKMSRSTADAMDTGLNAAMGITGAAGAGAVYKAISTANKEAKRRKTLKKSKKMTASEGSFRVGGLSRQRLDSIAAHRNKQARMKKEKQQEENIRKTEISPMGARTGKSVDKKDFIKRRLELGSLKSVVDVMRDVKRGQKNPSSVLKKAKGGMLKARRGVLADAMESQRALQKSRYLSALEKAMKENKDRLTARDIEAAKEAPKKRKGGMLKARSGKLAESMKKLREKAYEKSGKKYKGVGRYGKDEYMIQKKLPGMRTGKAVDTLKVIPTVKGRKQIAKDFSPSEKNKKTNKYKDYK